VLVEFVNLPHHLELPTYRGDTRLAPLEQHRIARSGIYPKWFSRGVLLNFNLHLEHHLFPTLPWHELENARRLVRPALGPLYNETFGSQWLRRHRKFPIDALLAPRPEEQARGAEKKVA
jgi:fatty acid desaturase